MILLSKCFQERDWHLHPWSWLFPAACSGCPTETYRPPKSDFSVSKYNRSLQFLSLLGEVEQVMQTTCRLFSTLFVTERQLEQPTGLLAPSLGLWTPPLKPNGHTLRRYIIHSVKICNIKIILLWVCILGKPICTASFTSLLFFESKNCFLADAATFCVS